MDAHVITDRDSGQSKGFAFVEMSTQNASPRAIAELTGTMLDKRTLRMDEAGERPTSERGGRYGGDRQGNAGGYGGYQEPSRRTSASGGDRW